MTKIRSTFLALVAILLSPMTANADFIYDWSGPCAWGCKGTATAQIVLSDSYVPGTVLRDASLFQLFTFSSSLGSFTITAATVDNNSPYIFRFDPNGGFSQIASDTRRGYPFWRVRHGWFDGGIGHKYYVGRNSGYTWQQVSEPGTLALLGIGLLGMGLVRRRLR